MTDGKKKRRQRIDSNAAAVDVMRKAASARLDPPSTVPLEADALPFFASVVGEAPKSEWTAHKLEMAALLARAMARLVREEAVLAAEDGVVASPNGGVVANPRHAVCKGLRESILAMRRSLALHARAQGGDARDIARRRQQTREIEDGNPLDDELLARPN